MFRAPLRRDPLVVVWALLMVAVAFVALDGNTTWHGHLEAERVAGFLRDLSAALFWSFLLLLLLAWLRSRRWPRKARRLAEEASTPPLSLPWTDRWIRDWREAAAHGAPAPTPEPVTCRHGVRTDEKVAAGQTPVLRALSVSHTIVRPGSSVNVTWCFENALDVVVDGQPGHPVCGAALVQIDASRRVEVAGRNRRSTTVVATATVVAMEVPQLHLPTVSAPPPVALHADVAATAGVPTPITQRLDDFWATQESLRPQMHAPAGLVGVPNSVVDGLRRANRTTGES